MDTRTLGYIGLGVLVGIVVATLIGVPPFIWITAAIVALGIAAAVTLGLIDGTTDAARLLGTDTFESTYTPEATVPGPVRNPEVEMELVRAGDLVDRVPAVWLHRRGGRRVHRYEAGGAWVVERVTTKDPDNPKKRIIGEPLTFGLEADAIAAADDLAMGNEPATPYLERPNLVPA